MTMFDKKHRGDSQGNNPLTGEKGVQLAHVDLNEGDRELPPVNASKPASKGKKAVVIAVLGALAALLVYQMGGTEDRKVVAAKKKAEEEAKSNPIDGKLPELSTPARPPMPAMAQGQFDASAGAAVDPTVGQPGQVPAAGQPAGAPTVVPSNPNGQQYAAGGGYPRNGADGRPVLSPWEQMRDRRRNGEVAVAFDTRSGGAATPAGFAEAQGDGRPAEFPGSSSRDDAGSNTELGKQLQGTSTKATLAGKLFDRNYLIPKGAFLDCALETRIDSTVPGMTSCILTRNIYSDNGKLVLLDRGSKIVGEYAGGLKQGQARIFVLWTRIQTPKGVIINLDSPGTDALGASGHDGYVDTHFWARFGGAIMLSLIDDFAAYASKQDQNNADTSITFGNTRGAATEMATEALKNSINIPPTLTKNHGEHINIYIARDLDFRSVYGVRISK